MADLSITAANVIQGDDGTTVYGVAGATITAGQVVYADGTDNNDFKLADADSSEATSEVVGIALHGASDGQPLAVHSKGDLDVGATLTIGEIYVLSGTAGGIAPEADLAVSDWVSILGVADATDNLIVSINNSGAQIPVV